MRKRELSHETGRKCARPVRVARTSATARATVFLLVAFLVMANFAPVRAFADVLNTVYNNPSVQWSSLQSCAVYGPSNEFDAALAIIERTYAKIQITEPMFVELSNEGTGGRFYELAQSLKCAADEEPSPTSDFLLYNSVNTGVILYGAGYVWWQQGITFNDELLSGALEDFETIINGGHLGGGAVGDYITLEYKPKYLRDKQTYGYRYDWDGYTNILKSAQDGQSALIGSPVYLHIPSTMFRFNNSTLDLTGYNVYARVGTSSSGNGSTSSSMRLYFILNKNTATVSTSDYTYTYNNETLQGQYYSSLSFSANDSGKTCDYTFTSSQFSCNGSNIYIDNDVTVNVSGNYSSLWSHDQGFAIPTNSAGGGGGGTNNWPEPTEPTPDPPDPPDPIDRPVGGTPDIPEPGDPTVPETPQPSNPTTNIYVHVEEPTNTSPTDYTPWLRAILRAINNLGDKLNDESLEIQRALNTFYTNLVATLKSISGNFLQDLTSWGRSQMQWLAQDLQYSLTMFGADLTEYLDDLAQWIVDNLNFDFPGAEFDDSSIVYWLKRIWSKLGNGSINTRPTDPTEDPDGFLEWLRKAIAEFILGLGASASDVVSDLGDLLSRLFAKFPFSVPWDILGILGLLDAPTATPRVVIDIPINIGSWHTTYTFDVNLQPYDSAMATARSVFLILFCSWLLWLTPQVLRDLSPEDFL